MDLSPEEKQRIYLEEKARLEAQACVKAEQKQVRRQRRLRFWGPILIGLCALIVWGLFESNPTRGPRTQSAPCRLDEQRALIAQAQTWEALYSIEGTKIYVTERWMRWPLKDKVGLDDAIQCVATGGSGNRFLLSYHDYRTGQQLATSSYKLKLGD